MRMPSLAGLTVSMILTIACSQAPQKPAAPATRWTLAADSAAMAPDEALRGQMFRALDAAEHAGTDPGISKFQVRCATVVNTPDGERTILGGNSEYTHAPEAIHGETSIMNHVITELGAQASKDSVRFIAFYSETCGGGGSCGDCRDYLTATTQYEQLLIACGQASDHTVHLQRFGDGIVPEERLKEVAANGIPLVPRELDALVKAATQARSGGVSLFTTSAQHLGAAAISFTGHVYTAAGADDAAFHYRTPVGGALQQAATQRDYFIKAVLVAGEPGRLPRVSYRDRQYGYEFSSFNRKKGRAPIQLVLVEGPGRYRLGTFEEALPHAFSAGDFLPDAVDRFLNLQTR